MRGDETNVTLRLVILFALLALSPTAHAESGDPQLAAFIESELTRESVPGAAVTVIRNHRIAWTQTFGVANTLTGDPVTEDTPFPAASNGKPIAAWLVVQLAARGAIDLARPVREQARVNLPDTPDHRRITPSHLLTHTSGLGNFLRDSTRDLGFKPGERFSYAGVGFMVLQELLEAKTNRTLDAYAREALFDPLAMPHSWYGATPPTIGAVAAPHVSLGYALIPFGIVGAIVFALVASIVLLVERIRTRKWQARRAAFIAAAAAPLAALALFLYLSGSAPMTAWFIAVPLALIAPLAIFARLARTNVLLGVGLFAVWAIALAALRDTHIPLPVDDTANAASSLRASAPDLARFMIELAKPQLGDTAATAEMTKPHQRIDDIASWGLGIGVERHAKGRDLWQWGSNPGAKSLMIISPETGDGVVILTNAEVDGAFTRRIAAKILDREGCWRAGCE
jgi:CubicO group peptidase (beta-lactamase class C family)